MKALQLKPALFARLLFWIFIFETSFSLSLATSATATTAVTSKTNETSKASATSATGTGVGTGTDEKGSLFFPYKEKILKNGLRMHLIYNNELPRIQVKLVLSRGSTWDPPNKAGLGRMTAHMLNQGTRSLNRLQLSSAFAQIGSHLKIVTGFEFISFGASTLSSYKNRLLKLMQEVLLSPRMDKKDFLRERNKIIQTLSSLPDQTDDFASRLFRQEVFPSSPYGRPYTGWRFTLKKIHHEDMVRHYFQHYRPDQFTLVLSGDIQASFIKRAERAFSTKQWKKTKVWQAEKSDPQLKNSSPPNWDDTLR